MAQTHAHKQVHRTKLNTPKAQLAQRWALSEGRDSNHWLTHNNGGRGDGGVRKSKRVVARHLINDENQSDDGTAQFP
ncbi:hypothetical protein V6N11_051511 [Hibiscus sabdariffa]|uniref:Uncharacterized protein n=1 Tax=Hibiscus sabdariffa TaxID=183260 RepID=A0ABR2U7J9_9ROSI